MKPCADMTINAGNENKMEQAKVELAMTQMQLSAPWGFPLCL